MERMCMTCGDIISRSESVCPTCGSLELEIIERVEEKTHQITHQDVLDMYDDFSDLSNDCKEPVAIKSTVQVDEFDNFSIE